MLIVWHGNYVKYFEQARCELLRMFNYDYPQMQESGFLWPIIDLRLRYARSAKFGQKLVCTATLVEFENRLKIKYEIKDADGNRLTRGHSVQVAVEISTQEMQLVSPQFFIDKINCIVDFKGN